MKVLTSFGLEQYVGREDIAVHDAYVLVRNHKRASVGQHFRVVVDVQHFRGGVDCLDDVVNAIAYWQPSTAVDKLGHADSAGQVLAGATQELLASGRHVAGRRGDLLDSDDEPAIDRVVVLTALRQVPEPGAARPGKQVLRHGAAPQSRFAVGHRR